MSSRKLTKSHSENLSNNQICLNGVAPKRNLMKQEEIDLAPESHQLDKERTVKTVHSISICINTFDENLSEDNMRQELANDIGQVSEIVDNLGNDIKQIKITDKELRQSSDASLPINDHCDSKDKKRTKHLVRCEAVRESSLSPPPTSLDVNQVNPNKISLNANHLTVYSNNKNITKNSSLKSSSNSNSAASSPSLSRDSSTENNLEYSTAELLAFLTESLKKNQKDRMYLLRIEQEIIQLISDSSKDSHKFTASSSYNRMLIHRVAAYFGLEHNVDHTHTSVIVSKTKNTHIPEVKLKELIKDEESTDQPKKLILKRDSTSLEDSSGSSFDKDKSPDSHLNGSLSDSSRSRSLEEREENYERVRARIFNNSSNSSINEEQKLPTGSSSPVAPAKETAAVESNATEEAASVATAACATAAAIPTVSSLETESQSQSQSDCDKGKDALLPSDKPVSTTNGNTTTTTTTTTAAAVTSAEASPAITKSPSNSSNTSQPGDARKPAGATTHNRFDGGNNNRGKYGNMRNRGYSEHGGGGGGYHRYSQNRKGDCGKDNDWSPKPNLNSKLASQNMPYNFLYPNCVDGGPFVHRFPPPPTLNPHASVANQFPLGNPYLQSPLLPNEQLFPQVNYVNPSMLPLMPNHYQQFMYNNLQSMQCGPNGMPPYSPSGNLPAYNSLMGMSPYQAYGSAGAAGALPLNNLMCNMPPNLSDFEKGQMKTGGGNFGKASAMPSQAPPPPLNYPMAPGQFSCPEVVLDRNLGQVQFNASHLPPDLMLNGRAALHHQGTAAAFALNYAQHNKRQGSNAKPLAYCSNSNDLKQQQQQQTTMYLNSQQQQHQHQQQQQPKSFFSSNNGNAKQNGTGKYANNRSGRRGGGPQQQNPSQNQNQNRKY